MRIRTISVRLCEDKFEARARFFLAGQFPLAACECFFEVIMQVTRVRFGVCACAAVACKCEVRRLHGRLLCSQLCIRSCEIRVQISSDNALRDLLRCGLPGCRADFSDWRCSALVTISGGDGQGRGWRRGGRS